MEDLGSGAGSPYQFLDGSDPQAAEEAILDYARTLGRLHACTSANRDRFRELRAGLPCPLKRRPLYHDPWSNASAYSEQEIRQAVVEYRAVLSALGGLPEPGIDDEIEEVTRLVKEHQGEFLVLCQCDQNSPRPCIRHHYQLRYDRFWSCRPSSCFDRGNAAPTDVGLHPSHSEETVLPI